MRPVHIPAYFVLITLLSLTRARELILGRQTADRWASAAQLSSMTHQSSTGKLEWGPSEVQECMKFLYKHMPEADRDDITWPQLLGDAVLALQAASSTPWAKAVPWEVFLNDVLPYASLDERREPWRPFLAPLLQPLVKDTTSISEAAQILNRDIWSMFNITFKSDQTPEIISPFQVISAGYASCTGLSIFLVAACRAVGIPARVAGTPIWVTSPSANALDKHDYNNHNWVEVWDDGQWSFMGAAEYDAQGMNRTWFFPMPAKQAVPGDRLHAIYAATWAPSGPHCNVNFPLVWNDKWMQNGCDVTTSYLNAEVVAAGKQ